MTIVTKPSIVIKKPDNNKTPLFDDFSLEEDLSELPPQTAAQRRARRWSNIKTLMVLVFAAVLMALLSVTSGSMLYRLLLNEQPLRRYHGFCAIPINDPRDFAPVEEMENQQMMEPNYRVMALQWSSDPEVQVFSSDDGSEGKHDMLREQVLIDNDVENISVYNEDRTVQFIHDFSANMTGIIEPARCFVMELSRESVLSPGALLGAIAAGAAFDVTHRHSTRRASLPPLQGVPLPALHVCLGRPLYHLLADDEPKAIRKRSADAPKFDYMQFSGKHIEQIEIANLAEVLDYEKNHI